MEIVFRLCLRRKLGSVGFPGVQRRSLWCSQVEEAFGAAPISHQRQQLPRNHTSSRPGDCMAQPPQCGHEDPKNHPGNWNLKCQEKNRWFKRSRITRS
uniref:Uncharacterized protein n=1 Tax=Zea mays TaxID=4577 RepID=B6TWL2_MAIZE|nr:hypothetical protein [Zea mays]